ncbi:hypothetical protein [Kitasatospora sp. NPDC057541]|uniref:hypothetical protein n=1 Tax=Kitasatospora sp. NPDC057541 TaxID=3346161 RepID=UPI003688A055
MANDNTGKDAPLPAKSRDDALTWARQITEHVAHAAGIQINAEPVEPLFSPCVGRNGESAPDDRFTLAYAVHSYVPNARHNDVVRAVRDVLTTEGLKISEYQRHPPPSRTRPSPHATPKASTSSTSPAPPATTAWSWASQPPA